MQRSKKYSAKKWINRYTITILGFFIWISILDSRYSWVKQFKLTRQLEKMEKNKEEYEFKLAEAQTTYNDLMKDKEKFAREKYFIRKQGEDIYIIK